MVKMALSSLLKISMFHMAFANIYKLQEFQDILDKNLSVSDCDFGGKTIKGLTILEPYLMRIDPIKDDSLMFDNQSQTYEITNIARGMIIDILNELSQVCNFKYEIHLGREISLYGTVDEYSNGTTKGTGLFEYFTTRTEFDMIFADLNYSPERMKVVDYLPPFSGKAFDFE